MTDLVDFLKARVAEDETVALMTYDDPTFGRTWPDMDGEMRSSELLHSRRHDPARVLREIAAKLRIVEDYRIARSALDQTDSRGSLRAGADAFYAACLALASVYSDHPDFNERWPV